MDVFISYEHESKSIADNICAVLESKGVRCWYAPRDVYGDYATSIVDAIEHCRVFILVLNHNSSNSPHVLNEVEMAYQRILNGEITIVPFKVDDGILSKAMEYYVKRLHWIDAVSAPLEQAINQLYDQLVPILGITKQASHNQTGEPSCGGSGGHQHQQKARAVLHRGRRGRDGAPCHGRKSAFRLRRARL